MVPNFAPSIDRLPPSNIDAEESVLGGILLDPNAIDRIKDILSPEAFYITANQTIYRAALAVRETGRSTDLLSIQTWLLDHNFLESIGGTSKLSRLVDNTVSAVNIDVLAQLVNEKYLRRRIIETGSRIAQMGYQSSADSSVLLEEMRIRLEELQASQIGVSARDKLINKIKKIALIESPVDQWMEWDKLSKETGKSKTRLIELSLAIAADEPLKIWTAKEFSQRQLVTTKWLIEGLLRMGTTSLLVAESKTGKSLLHYDWAYSIATGQAWGEFSIAQPSPVLIVQTDEPEIDCQERIKYRGLAELDNVDIITKFSPQQMARIRREIANRNYGLIVLDSLTSINRFSGFSINDAAFSYFMYELKELASEFGCHILCIHHTNKAPVQAGLDKVAGTYAIPASVSDILMLSRAPESEESHKDLIRVLRRLGSRSDKNSAWKLELNLEDNSYIYHGNCDDSGNIDEAADKESQAKLENKDLILALLKANAPTAFEAIEVAEELKINLHSARVILGQLSKGSAPIIAAKRSTRNPRAKAYYYPSDRDETDDQMTIRCSNADGESDSADSTHLIEQVGTEKFSQSVTVEPEMQIECDSLPQSGKNFSSDRIDDQMNENASSSVPARNAPSDRHLIISTDDQMEAPNVTKTSSDRDRLSEASKPPYPSVGDWVWSCPMKNNRQGMIGYIAKLVNGEARAAIVVSKGISKGKIGEINVSKWAWEKGHCEPYNPSKHPQIPQQLLDFAQEVAALLEESDRPEDDPAALANETAETIAQTEAAASPSTALPSREEESDRPVDETPGASAATPETAASTEVEGAKVEKTPFNSQWEIGDCLVSPKLPQVKIIDIFPATKKPLYVLWHDGSQLPCSDDDLARHGYKKAPKPIEGDSSATEPHAEDLAAAADNGQNHAPVNKASAELDRARENFSKLKKGDFIKIKPYKGHQVRWNGLIVQVRALREHKGEYWANALTLDERMPSNINLAGVELVPPPTLNCCWSEEG